MTKDERIYTRRWLNRYRFLKQELAARTKNYEEYKRDIYDPLCSPAMDGMPHGSSVSDQTAATVERIQRTNREILDLMEQKIKNLQAEIKEIEDTINQLDADERCVLYHRFILGIYWADLPAYIYYDDRQCRRIEARALSRVWESMKSCPTMTNLHVLK